MACFAARGGRALLPKPGSEQQQLSQAAPGKPRDEKKTLGNEFFPPQPKAEALVYSQGSNQQSKALGVFLIPHAMVPCTLDEVSPLKAWADTRTPDLGAVHPLFWLRHWAGGTPVQSQGCPSPHGGVPTASPRGTPRLQQQEEKQQRENPHGKSPAIIAHGEDLRRAVLPLRLLDVIFDNMLLIICSHRVSQTQLRNVKRRVKSSLRFELSCKAPGM